MTSTERATRAGTRRLVRADRLVRGARVAGRARRGRARRSRSRRRPGRGASGGRGQVTVDWDAGRGRRRLPRPPGRRARRARSGRSTTRAATCSPSPTGRSSTRRCEPGRDRLVRRVVRAVDRGADRRAVGARRGPRRRRPARRRVEVARGRRPRSGSPLARPWRPMVGSEHLALLLRGEGPGGRHVGDELAEAFRIARAELGARVASAPTRSSTTSSACTARSTASRVHDFDTRRRRPGAAPRDRPAAGRRAVVHAPRPRRRPRADRVRLPRDHLAAARPRARGRRSSRRSSATSSSAFGRDEVAALAVRGLERAQPARLLVGRPSPTYFDLYDATARAVKRVDPRVPRRRPVDGGGRLGRRPARARAGTRRPGRLLSTHTYGMPPLDLRPIAARYGRADLPLLWTEWGISPTHGSPVNDSVWGAPLVARGMRSAAGRLDALSYWVTSDHFVELGEPERAVPRRVRAADRRQPAQAAVLGRGAARAARRHGELARPARRRRRREPRRGVGDARRTTAGSPSPLWNGTLDQSKWGGDPLLDRECPARRSTGCRPATWTVRHHRVDETHSNSSAHWDGGGDWPDEAGWDDSASTTGSRRSSRSAGRRSDEAAR